MLGDTIVLTGYCDAYNIGQNCGKEAGQTVDYPMYILFQDVKEIWKILVEE